MNTGPALVFPSSTETQVEQSGVRPVQAVVIPDPGSSPSGETIGPPKVPAVAASPQDEVKLQFEPPGEIAVYQFVDQHGTLILQVPPQQLLDLARQISQELAQDAAPKESAGAQGGKNNGR
jgi:hypothetical protein